MLFVTALKPAKNRERVFDVRLVDHDRLEPPFQRGVFLDVLAVFVERRRANALDFAARERRLEQVRRVRAALLIARPDDRVQLVDKENDAPERIFHFFEDRLEPLFEFASEFRAGNERAHIERDDLFILQAFGHVPFDDTERKSFDDRRFAYARIPDEDRIVLSAAREDLNNAPDFRVAADNRIQFAFPRFVD